MEDRLLTIETHLDSFQARFNAIDQRLDRLDARIDQLQARMDSNLKWLLGVILATWITTIGAVIGTALAR